MIRDLVTLPGLAQLLNMSAITLRAEADAGRIPCLKLGDSGCDYVFSVSAVVANLTARATETKAEAAA